MSSDSIHTVNFIKIFDDLFDTFNSITQSEPKVFRRPLSKDSCHREFLIKADKFLYNLTIHNKSEKQPSCITSWRENISSLKLPFKELNEYYDIDFLLTRRLTRDCIENVFSVVRSKGGNNVNPDASKFNSSMRMLICNHLLTPSKGGNCEIDACQFLTKLHEIKMVDLKIKTTVNETHQVNDKKDANYIHSLMDNLLSPTNIQKIFMDEHNSSAVGMQ